MDILKTDWTPDKIMLMPSISIPACTNFVFYILRKVERLIICKEGHYAQNHGYDLMRAHIMNAFSRGSSSCASPTSKRVFPIKLTKAKCKLPPKTSRFTNP